MEDTSEVYRAAEKKYGEVRQQALRYESQRKYAQAAVLFERLMDELRRDGLDASPLGEVVKDCIVRADRMCRAFSAEQPTNTPLTAKGGLPWVVSAWGSASLVAIALGGLLMASGDPGVGVAFLAPGIAGLVAFGVYYGLRLRPDTTRPTSRLGT